MSPEEIRLRILEVVVPVASRHGISEPSVIVETCGILEKYVLDSQQDKVSPDLSVKRKAGRPRKEGTENAVPDFLDPTRGG